MNISVIFCSIWLIYVNQTWYWQLSWGFCWTHSLTSPSLELYTGILLWLVSSGEEVQLAKNQTRADGRLHADMVSPFWTDYLCSDGIWCDTLSSSSLLRRISTGFHLSLMLFLYIDTLRQQVCPEVECLINNFALRVISVISFMTAEGLLNTLLNSKSCTRGDSPVSRTLCSEDVM